MLVGAPKEMTVSRLGCTNALIGTKRAISVLLADLDLETAILPPFPAFNARFQL